MALARSPDTMPIKKKKYERLATRCLKSMKKAANYCKRNCLNKFLLLEAEFQVLKGDLNNALELFEKSASLSGDEGFMHEQVIAYERAGLAVLYRTGSPFCNNDASSPGTASDYFFKSLSLYREWDAATKVNQMAERHNLNPESDPK